MTIVVTGASGLLGSALVTALRQRGETVVRLVRRAPRSDDESFWNPEAGHVDRDVLAAADAVVHLAGASIGDHRWSAAYKREILDSRVNGTRTLVSALNALSRPARAWC